SVKILKTPFALLSLLALPLVTMQFTNEVRWSVGDFVVMGLLLLSLGLSIELVLEKIKSTSKRWFYLGVVLLIFILIWAELAVGILNSPWAGS
ncbi:MAG: hypothetical protein VW266_02230, partial [Flavobacteriales bacterium]